MALPSSGPISLGDVRTELGLNGSISLGQKEVRDLAGVSSGSIGLDDLYFPDPKKCDYYFETRKDLKDRIDDIIIENNGDLINKTFGFGEDVTSLHDSFTTDIFYKSKLYSTPKMIISKNVINFNNAFGNSMINDYLSTISFNLFKYCPNATDFFYCFDSRKNLTEVPKDLFKYNTKAMRFEGCFNNCSNITSNLPDVWNKEKFPNVTYASFYAYNCTKAANYNEIPNGFK